MLNRSLRRRALRLQCLGALFASSVAAAATLPTPPQTFDTTYTPPSGSIINVAAGGDLQTALNNAQLGDTIVLAAGASFTGPFKLPNKTTGSGWIYITTSGYASLPAPGKRVSPSNAAAMAKIISPAYNNAVVTVANSHHYRFVGIEFTPAPNSFTYNIITIGNQDKTPATLPNHIVFDRCYVHGNPAAGNRRGIELDGAYAAVIDSYIDDIAELGADNQAIALWNTSGPIKIVDNYLEAAGENILFGGADSAAPSLVPSDIEIRNNYMFKPLSLIGTKYTVKNILEFKSAQRVIASGNILQNNPAAAQNGFALLVTPRNQGGTAPWSTATDIAITGNVFINVNSGVNILGTDNNKPSQKVARVAIENNVLGITGLVNSGARAFMISNGGSDITIDHNTILNSAPTGIASDVMMSDPQESTGLIKVTNFVFTNNLATATVYGFYGSGAGYGTAALNSGFNNWTFEKNALVGQKEANYPAGNFFPASTAAVGFASYAGGAYAGGAYTLGGSSPYKNAGTDGLDLGANLDATTLAGNASSVIIPNPPSNVSVR
jgi:hypothetical protein